MNFFTGLLIFFLVTWLIFRLFGRQIAAWAMRRLFKKVESEMKKQTERYQQNYGSTPYEEQVFRGQDMEVRMKKKGAKKKPTIEEMGIDEVEYEEVQ